MIPIAPKTTPRRSNELWSLLEIFKPAQKAAHGFWSWISKQIDACDFQIKALGWRSGLLSLPDEVLLGILTFASHTQDLGTRGRGKHRGQRRRSDKYFPCLFPFPKADNIYALSLEPSVPFAAATSNFNLPCSQSAERFICFPISIVRWGRRSRSFKRLLTNHVVGSGFNTLPETSLRHSSLDIFSS